MSDIVKTRVYFGFRPKDSQRDMYLMSEFHEACLLGNLVELKRLVEAGEDVDDISPWGETGIVIALLADRLDCAAYLFDRGCSIDIRNRQGETLRDTIGDHPYMQSLVAKRELIEMLEMELPVITTTKKRRM